MITIKSLSLLISVFLFIIMLPPRLLWGFLDSSTLLLMATFERFTSEFPIVFRFPLSLTATLVILLLSSLVHRFLVLFLGSLSHELFLLLSLLILCGLLIPLGLEFFFPLLASGLWNILVVPLLFFIGALLVVAILTLMML